MEFAEVVRRRRMVRSYTAEPLDPSVVERLLTNATHAPSAGFTQGWAFLVLDGPDDIRRFWTATTPDEDGTDAWSVGMRRAPVIVVPLSCQQSYLDRYAEPDKGWTDREVGRWPVPYWHIDAGMAALLMLLTAVDEGLGACFFGIPPQRVARFRTAFDVPAGYTPIGAVSLGHRSEERVGGSAATRPRRTLEEVVHRGRW